MRYSWRPPFRKRSVGDPARADAFAVGIDVGDGQLTAGIALRDGARERERQQQGITLGERVAPQAQGEGGDALPLDADLGGVGAVGEADGRAAGHIVEENSRAVVVGRNAAEEKRGITDAALRERADQTARGGAELGAGDVRGVRRGDGKEGAVLRRSAAVGEHTVRMKVELALALDDDLRAIESLLIFMIVNCVNHSLYLYQDAM